MSQATVFWAIIEKDLIFLLKCALVWSHSKNPNSVLFDLQETGKIWNLSATRRGLEPLVLTITILTIEPKCESQFMFITSIE